MKFNVNALLKDKYVLYVVLFLAVTNLFGYLMMRNFDSIVFFLVVGFLTSYFSKNMIIIMLVAMLTTNLLGAKMFMTKEGLEGMKKEEKEEKDKKKKKHTIKKENLETLNPSSLNEAIDEEDGGDNGEIRGHKPKIDYASTLESAYDNLDKLLNSDAINKMSIDTQRLAEKQQLLMGNIDKLAPMITKAEGLIGGINFGNMEGMMNKIQGLVATTSQKTDEKKKGIKV